jgi:hypothetical protein
LRHPDQTVQADDDIHAFWAAWRRQVVKVGFQSTDEVRRDNDELAVSKFSIFK